MESGVDRNPRVSGRCEDVVLSALGRLTLCPLAGKYEAEQLVPRQFVSYARLAGYAMTVISFDKLSSGV